MKRRPDVALIEPPGVRFVLVNEPHPIRFRANKEVPVPCALWQDVIEKEWRDGWNGMRGVAGWRQWEEIAQAPGAHLRDLLDRRFEDQIPDVRLSHVDHGVHLLNPWAKVDAANYFPMADQATTLPLVNVFGLAQKEQRRPVSEKRKRMAITGLYDYAPDRVSLGDETVRKARKYRVVITHIDRGRVQNFFLGERLNSGDKKLMMRVRALPRILRRLAIGDEVLVSVPLITKWVWSPQGPKPGIIWSGQPFFWSLAPHAPTRQVDDREYPFPYGRFSSGNREAERTMLALQQGLANGPPDEEGGLRGDG